MSLPQAARDRGDGKNPGGCVRRAALGLAILLLGACTRTAPPPPPVAPPDDLSQLDSPIQRQFEQRHATLERVLADVRASDAQRAEAFGAVGQVHFAYGYFESAEEAFTRALEATPEAPRWRYLSAQVFEAQGRAEEAGEALRLVLERLPDHVPSRVILGELAADRGDSAAAEAHFEAALRHDPGNVRAWAARSRLALSGGDPEAALTHLQEALARQPDAAPLHYQAALVYRALGDPVASQRHLDRIPSQNVAHVKLGFDDPWMREIDQLRIGARHHDQRALRALAAGRYDVAVIELRQALAANPERIYARHGLGAALAQLGHHDQALAELRLLLDEAPHHVPTWVLMAKILLDDGQPAEAARALDRALEQKPDDAEALRLKARLEARE